MKPKDLSYLFPDERKRHLYLVGNHALGYFKIGVSYDPLGRMKDLQVPFELELIVDIEMLRSQHAFSIEEATQVFFKEYKARGEWFSMPDPQPIVDHMTKLARYYNA
jgi:hypothetical protein